MSLFSDVDWTILLVIGGFLLLGDRGKDAFRTLGRMYGKFLRMREQLNFQVQSALMEPMVSAGNGPLPVVPTLPKKAVEAPPATASPPPLSAPPLGVAAEGGPPPIREVHTGSGVPSEGTEMFR